MIKLHQAKLSDTFEVLHVLNTALEKKRSYGDNAWDLDKFTTSETLPYIEAGELHIVLESGDVTGVVVLQESDEDLWGAEGLDGKALYMSYHCSLQKGLGKKMLDAAELLAKKKGKKYVRGICSYENANLYNYYVTLDCKEVHRKGTLALLQKEV